MKRACLIATLTVLLGLAGIAPAIHLLANNPTASIAGTVSDPSRAVIPGAQVVVRNIKTGVERRTVTNQVGAYRVAGLHVGEYELQISYGAFQPWKLSSVLLRVGDELRADATLTIQGSETIDVTEAITVAQTESSATSTVVNERQIQELPLNGRQLQNLALLVPGVAA
ncbi:MAG: carboxypeptidase-like regulatory domain-containing protein, partial [Acidobacteria bacterium]|nr:carboxypeptidase-like regulatory domain-containing protein [Acidobacteriota bacterium]